MSLSRDNVKVFFFSFFQSVDCQYGDFGQNFSHQLYFSFAMVTKMVATWIAVFKFQSIDGCFNFYPQTKVAKQLKEQQMVMRGHRDKSMVHELNR